MRGSRRPYLAGRAAGSWLLFAGALGSAGFAASLETVPQAYPASRYQALWENSPFELEVPATAAAEPGSPLAEDYALTGITKVKGKTVVTLLDKKAGTSFDLREDQPREDLRLLGIAVNPDPLLTEVKLARGSLSGSVGYDRKSLASAPKRPQALAAAGTAGAPPGQPAQSVLNRSPENPNPGLQMSRRIIRSVLPPQVLGRSPAAPPPQGGMATAPIRPGNVPVLPAPPGTPGMFPPGMTAPRQAPTASDRRQILVPQPLPPQS